VAIFRDEGSVASRGDKRPGLDALMHGVLDGFAKTFCSGIPAD
jgi:hypothetical protein